MSDVSDPHSDLATALAEIADLENQLKAIAAERDRYAFEKTEVVARANSATRERDDLRIALAAAGADRDRHAAEKSDALAKAQSIAKERDGLRDKLTALTAERDRLAAEKEAVSADRDRHAAEKSDALTKAQSIGKERDELRDMLTALTYERDRLAAEKTAVDQIANSASAECARLRHQLENLPPPDPAKVLFDFASEQTNAGIGKIRSLIPPESPALGWFDKTVAIVTEVGCFAVQAIRAFLRWLIPHLRGHYAYVKGKIEAQLAKKQ